VDHKEGKGGTSENSQEATEVMIQLKGSWIRAAALEVISGWILGIFGRES
jgi:hypothetical protein